MGLQNHFTNNDAWMRASPPWRPSSAMPGEKALRLWALISHGYNLSRLAPLGFWGCPPPPLLPTRGEVWWLLQGVAP